MWVTPARATRCRVSCRAMVSGVVSSPLLSPAGVTRPTVPSEAAWRPSRAQICRTKAATDVLPLVPVTAATVPGCSG